jgi:PAS domain S-box-containing protein
MSRIAAPASTRPPSLVFLLASNRSVIDEVADCLAIADNPVEIHVLRDAQRLDAHMARVTPDILIIDRASFGVSSLDALLTTGPLAGTPALVLDEVLDASAQQAALGAGARAYLPSGPTRGRAIRDAINVASRRPALDRKLEETQRHFHAILEASSDGIFVVVDGRFQYVNQTFASSIGYSVADLLASDGLLELVSPSDRDSVHDDLARVAMSTGARDVFELVLVDSAGAHVRFEVACRTSTLDGRRAVVGVARDVTAVRELQAEIERSRLRAAHIERLRALGELAAGVAHDFNNALEAILGRVGVAVNKASRGESVQADLGVIESAARDAVETVRRIRDYSRPQGSSAWQDVDLCELAKNVGELVRSRAHGDVVFELDVRDVQLSIRGNAAEIREVVMNLVANAFDAVGDSGHIKLCACQLDEGPAIIVEDDGPGIPAELQKKIFEPFFTTKGEAGTGLGLSVSQGILRRHDASLEVDSAPGRGTRFRIVFTPPAAIAERSTPRDSGARRILVVDDDPNVADLLRDVLGDHGHDVGLASAIDDAILWLSTNPCDVLITDLDLKGTSGWKLARRVRETHPHIVIGLITGWPLGAPDRELHARGVDFVLTKPFTSEALLSAIEGTQRD